MIRYINKQKHSKTCGPVAMVNVFRKFGRKMSYERAIRLCGGDRVFRRGTRVKKLVQAFQKLGYDTTYTKIKYSEAKYFAQFKQFGVIMCHYWETPEDSRGHFTMLDFDGTFINNGKIKRYKKKFYKNTEKRFNHRFFYIIVKDKED